MRFSYLIAVWLCLLGHRLMSEGCIPEALTIIAHRGGIDGPIPQHSVAAYSVGADLGADYIETDLVFSKDGEFFCFHDLEIGRVTDVQSKEEFLNKKVNKTIQEITGTVEMEGWFADDLTSQELTSLRLKTKNHHLYDGHGPLDTQFVPVKFTEYLDLVEKLSKANAKQFGIYPELKNPSYFRSKGFKPEEKILQNLEEKGYVQKVTRQNSQVFYENLRFNKKGKSLVYIQSFDEYSLRLLSNMTSVPLVQLMLDSAEISSAIKSGASVPSYTKEGMAKIASYADGIGVHFPDMNYDSLKIASRARSNKLFIHAYTVGRDSGVYLELAENSVNGIFTDDVAVARIFNEQVDICDSEYYTKIFGVVLVSFLWCLPFAWLIFLQISTARKKKQKALKKRQMTRAMTAESESVPMLNKQTREDQEDDISVSNKNF